MRRAIFGTVLLLAMVLTTPKPVAKAQCYSRCFCYAMFLHSTSFPNPSCGYYPRCCVNYWIDCYMQYCQDSVCCSLA